MDEKNTGNTLQSLPENPQPTVVPAVMYKRFLSYLIDYYVQLFILAALFIIYALIVGHVPTIDAGPFLNIAVGLISTLLYYTFFETLWGKTPGKFISHTRVVTIDRQKANFSTILKRSLLRFIPFEMLSMLSSKNPLSWHDKFADTIVIDERNTQPTTKSGFQIFGVMLLEYILTAIVFIAIFVVIVVLFTFITPKDTLQNLQLKTAPSPTAPPTNS